MKKIYLFLFLIFGIFACKNESKNETVENIPTAPKDGGKGVEIMNKVIAEAGNHRYETASINFTFRNVTYKSVRNCGMFELSRTRKDSAGNKTTSTISNLGFTFTENGKEKTLADSTASNYENAVNSVHYFVQIPFGLNDPAVRKELTAEDSINGKAYYEIQVNFMQEGGGEDFQDKYMYWVNKEHYTIDYFAYSYETNKGGMRFREAINPRKVGGIRFVDYKNYAPKKGTTPKLEDLDELFVKDELQLYSTIENEHIQVEVLDRKCT